MEVRNGLSRLVGAGLLFQRGTPPEATYLFKHALVQDAAYCTLLRKQHRELHQSIAQRLEQNDPDVCKANPSCWRIITARPVFTKAPSCTGQRRASVPCGAPPIRKRSDIFAGPSRCLTSNLTLPIARPRNSKSSCN